MAFDVRRLIKLKRGMTVLGNYGFDDWKDDAERDIKNIGMKLMKKKFKMH